MPANLNRKQQREIKAVVERAKKDNGVPQTAQQSIPFQRMFPDGICRVTDSFYTKTIQFTDINYQLAQNEDKTAAFEYWCDFYNYFDPSISIQISCMNQYVNVSEMEGSIELPMKNDEFDEIREEYAGVLKTQLAKGNNGLMRKKYITFGIEAENVKVAKPRLERIETDIMNNLRAMGVNSHPLSGYERLKLLYQTMNPDTQEPFVFNYDMVARTGLSTKDFIAPFLIVNQRRNLKM